MKTAKPITFVKVEPGNSLYLTVYEIHVGSKVVGVVWKHKGFSYRGMEGWNRGIRLQDFHPIEWQAGKALGLATTPGISYSSRRRAVAELLGEVRETGPCRI